MRRQANNNSPLRMGRVLRDNQSRRITPLGLAPLPAPFAHAAYYSAH
jgi:hypothetical protein